MMELNTQLTGMFFCMYEKIMYICDEYIFLCTFYY